MALDLASVTGSAGWREVRQGWRTLAGCTVGMGSGINMFAATSGFFVKPLAAEFGWARATVALGSVALLLAAMMMPLMGVVIDRRGSRLFVLAGTLMFAAAYVALATMNGSLAVYALILCFIGLFAGPATTALVFSRPLVGTFRSARGLALAIGLSGSVLLAIVVLPVLQDVIARFGWRAGYAFLCPVGLAAGVLSWSLLPARRAPDAATDLPAAGPSADGATFGEAVRDPRFWLLVGMLLTASLVLGAFQSQLQPLLSDAGIPGRSAALIGAWASASVVIGRIGCGFLLDRFWPPLVASMAVVSPLFGFLVMLQPNPSIPAYALGVVLVGLAQGAEGDILAFFTARYFGLRSFGAIFGPLAMVFGVAYASGGFVGATIFDRTGSYDLMLKGGCLMSLLAAACLFTSGLLRSSAGDLDRHQGSLGTPPGSNVDASRTDARET